MRKVVSIGSKRAAVLCERRKVEVALPEFAVRALEYRVDLTNETASSADEHVTLNDVIKWYVLSPLSVKEIPGLEEAVPGFTSAFAKWLFDSTYSPTE
jgi:hypothetical protein